MIHAPVAKLDKAPSLYLGKSTGQISRLLWVRVPPGALSSHFADVTQRLEFLPSKQGVEGSNPFIRFTITYITSKGFDGLTCGVSVVGNYKIEDLVEAVNFYNVKRMGCVKVDKPSLKTDNPFKVEPCAFVYVNQCKNNLNTPLGTASFEITDNFPGGLDIRRTRLHTFPICTECLEATKDIVRREVRRMEACDVWPYVFADRCFSSAADYFIRYLEGLVMMRMVLSHCDRMELQSFRARKAAIRTLKTDPALEAELRYNGRGNFDDIIKLVEE